MKHIQNEATAMIADWTENGFNGVSFIECYIEPTRWDDWENDGRTRAEYEAFIADYAIFVADPDLFCEYESPHKYETLSVDTHSFYKDLEAEIRRRLGDDIVIRRYENCHEFEIERIATC